MLSSSSIHVNLFPPSPTSFIFLTIRPCRRFKLFHNIVRTDGVYRLVITKVRGSAGEIDANAFTVNAVFHKLYVIQGQLRLVIRYNAFNADSSHC